MPSELVVVVHGRPAPQGSKRSLGPGRMVEQSPHVYPWREAVRGATEKAVAENHWMPPDGQVSLHCVFTLPRPRSHYRTGKHSGALRADAPQFPTTRPDLDKLLRATLDGLTDSGAIHDDSQIFHLAAAKVYPEGHLDALDTPGAVIMLATGLHP